MMNMMRNAKLAFAIVFLAILFSACDANFAIQGNGEDEIIISVVIYPDGYPSGNTSDVYFITLSSEGVLTTSQGGGPVISRTQIGPGQYLVESVPVDADFFLEIVRQTESIELTQDQLCEIIALTEKITDADFVDRGIWFGSWYIDVIFEGKVFQYVRSILLDPAELYGGDEIFIIPHMQELLHTLIEHSPIPIVLGWGWPLVEEMEVE